MINLCTVNGDIFPIFFLLNGSCEDVNYMISISVLIMTVL